MQPLPERTQLIADVIGRERALYFVSVLQKRPCSNPKQPQRLYVYIPQKLHDGHMLVQLLGWDDASKLVKAYGGEGMHLSECTNVKRGWRNVVIQRMKDEGISTADLAKRFAITQKQVSRIVKPKRDIPHVGQAV